MFFMDLRYKPYEPHLWIDHSWGPQVKNQAIIYISQKCNDKDKQTDS